MLNKTRVIMKDISGGCVRGKLDS